MDKNQIKEHLRNNPEYIKNILEHIGCHHVKIIKDKRVQGARPDGDNYTSVQVSLKSDLLSSQIITKKSEFDKFDNSELKDIFTLIQFIKKCDFSESIEIVCNICEIKYSKTYKKNTQTSGSLSFLRNYKRSIKRDFSEAIKEIVYEEEFKTRFIRENCKLFYDDNIYEQTQEKFYVCYDILDNRVVFPIRNYDGKIVSFKGRTNDEDFKIKGIPKYMYYYPIEGRYYLFGYYENYYDILNSDELLVFEAEKSVMQCDSMNVNNVISINKKIISIEQLDKLIKLHKDIVLIFDKGVTLEEIYIECRKFKGLCSVYYIYDYDDILKDKQSPTDRGFEIFYKLYTEYKFKYNGE